MELARSADGLKKEEMKRSDQHSVGDDIDESHHKQENMVEEPPTNDTNTEKSIPEAGPRASPTQKEKVDEQLETTKAEMGEVREENQRLKMCLNKVMNEYRILQMQFHDAVNQETKNKPQETITEEPELVSLSLGRVPRNQEKVIKVTAKPLKGDEKEEEEFNEELTLGLDCKFETSKSGSQENSCGDDQVMQQKEQGAETWAPSNNKQGMKTVRDMSSSEDEVSQQNHHAKKARVCVRARCDTPTMNDGCQWRKYGQKIAKGNPCPRAYYRCTVAQSCPVRKQVQRCADDLSILITTYEGTHNHPLPLSATAMASTTSAAASMLLSGSSTSHSASSSIPLTTTSNLHHGLNLYLPEGSKSSQLYISSPPLPSSSQPSHPTITLDLTSTNPSSASNPSSSSPFLRFSSNNNYYNSSQLPRYPSSTSLCFGSSSSDYGNFLNYGNMNMNMNILSNVNFGRQQQQQPMESFYQSLLMQKNINVPSTHQKHAVPDNSTLAAATKAITADPTFQSALALALSSFIGGTQPGNNNSQLGVGELNLSQRMKLAEQFSGFNSVFPNSTLKANNNSGCGTSFLNKTGDKAQSNIGSLSMFLPPSLPFSAASKSASAPPGGGGGDNRDSAN